MIMDAADGQRQGHNEKSLEIALDPIDDGRPWIGYEAAFPGTWHQHPDIDHDLSEE